MDFFSYGDIPIDAPVQQNVERQFPTNEFISRNRKHNQLRNLQI